MPKTSPRNLRRGVGRISGGIVEKLNAIGVASGLPGHENVGTELVREINQHLAKISVRQDAQAGFGGPVAIAPQGRQSASGPAPPGLIVGGNRISKTAPAIHDTDVPNLLQVKSLFTCENFGGHVSGFAGWMEDCIDDRTGPTKLAVTSGIVHAMWGYSYEIPGSSDTFSGDPGFIEDDRAGYWQFIIPVTTIVDRLTCWRVAGTGTVGNVSFGLYDMNQSVNVFPAVARTAIFDLSELEEGMNVIDLDSRVTIPPGLYALAYAAPCFHFMLAIRQNTIPWIMVNALWNSTWNGFNSNTPSPGDALPRYGAIITSGDMPDQLDDTNVDLTGDWDATSFGSVPLTYFDDSEVPV
jgi:hypothetical protein